MYWFVSLFFFLIIIIVIIAIVENEHNDPDLNFVYNCVSFRSNKYRKGWK